MSMFIGTIDDAATLMVRGLEREIKEAVMKRLHEVIKEEFNQIATTVSETMAKAVVQMHRDPMNMSTHVHVQIIKKELT